eukprot:8573802-Alexandrium_andersonii.AAC.1
MHREGRGPSACDAGGESRCGVPAAPFAARLGLCGLAAEVGLSATSRSRSPTVVGGLRGSRESPGGP